MQEVSIPPSPNWYLSQIVDCSEDGRLAYGSRETIVLFDDRKSSTTLITYAHVERVTSVQFAPSAAGNKLVSSGDDFVVRIWDLDTLQAVLAHIVHTNSQRTAVACWSHADPNLVVSADGRGFIVSWDLHTNLTRTFHFKLSFTTVSSSPHNKNIVALGTKTGLVYVMDINGKGRVLHKLRGHDVEIVSLAWCPVRENIFKPTEGHTCLLASGARDTSVYLWRTASDGRYEKEIHLPATPSPNSGHRAQLPGNTANQSAAWTALRWPEPNSLIAASQWGELIAYDLLKQPADSQKSGTWKSNNWRLLHAKHARGLFSIACKPYSYEKGGGDSQEEVVLWTVAQDRQVVSCTATSGNILRAMITVGGPVYSMALSPIDGSRLAVGVGDKSIRIWNLSDPDPDSMVSIWNKIAGRVYAVAWHPTKEGCLAYGTSDGRIGLYDTMGGNKPPVLFRLHFSQAVYVLQWGPNINLRGFIGSGGPAYPEKRENPQEESTPVKKSDYLLYAIADYQAWAFDPEKPSETPVNLKSILRSADAVGKLKMDRKRSALSWKPDNSLLAVGNEDGSVHLLTPHEQTGMRHIRTVLVYSKLIQDLVWHPPSSGKDYLPSYSSWLAVASNDSEIRVLDVSNLLANLDDVQLDTSELPCTVVAALKGHKQKVVTLAWNPHIGGQLLSTSYDESSVVWDVPSGKPLHSFSGHSSVVLCGLWSPLEPDFVITGSGDATLRVWEVSAQKEGAPDAKKKAKSYTGARQALPDKSFDTSNEREMERQQYPAEGGGVAVAKSEESLKQDKKKIKERSLFPVSSATMHESSHLLKNLESLLAAKADVGIAAAANGEAAVSNGDAKLEQKEDVKIEVGKSDEVPGVSAFFGNTDAVAHLLERERSALVQMDQFECAFTIDVWRSKIKDAVEEAAKKQKLTDHIVSLSPMASMKVWQSACLAYAEQLGRSGEYLRSAGYYLAVHKVEEAVTILLDHGLYRQAIAIAKSRLTSEDPFVKDVMRKWATQKIFEGQIEIATNCLASLGEWIEAADILRRRRNIPHLCVAAQLASRGGADEKAAAILLDCLKLNADENWPTLKTCLENLPNQNHLKLVVAVHELVLTRFKEKLDPERWLKGALKDDGPSLEFVLDGKSPGHEFGKIPISKHMRAPLQTLLASALSLSVRAEALLTVSINVALAMTFSPKSFTELPEGFTRPEEDDSESDVHEAVCKLVKAMEALSTYQLRDPESAHMLLKLCILLSPKGPTHPGSIFSEVTVSPAQKSSRAYLCTGVLNWLMENGLSFIPPKVEVFPDRKPPLKGRRRITTKGDANGVTVAKPEQPTERRTQQTDQIGGGSSLLPKQIADRSVEESTNRTTMMADESVQQEGQPSDAANVTDQQRSEIAERTSLTEDIIEGRERIVDKTGDEKTEPSNESEDQKAEPSNESEDQKAEPSNESEDQKAEPSNESEDQKAEPSNESEDQKAEPSNESEDQKAEPSNESEDQKAEPSNESEDQKAEPSNESEDQKAEPSNESEDQKAEPSNESEDQKAEPSNESEDQKAEPSNESEDQKAEPSNESEDQKAEPSNESEDQKAEPSNESEDQKAEPSNESEDQKAEPSNESEDQKAEPSNESEDQKAEPSNESEDQKTELLIETADEESHTANHTAESSCETADNTGSSVDGAIQDDQSARSADLTVAFEEKRSRVDYSKPAWIHALDLIKRYGDDVFSVSNLRYFSDSVRYQVLVHQEATATKEKPECKIPTAANSTETDSGIGETVEEGGKTDKEVQVAKTQAEGEAKSQGEAEAKSQEDREVGIRQNDGAGGLLNGEPTLTERQSEIKRLREWFVKFEKEQVIVPNPFVCYANLRLVLNETLMQVDKKQAEVYIEYFEKVWEEVRANKT